jgi:O-antigen ligase
MTELNVTTIDTAVAQTNAARSSSRATETVDRLIFWAAVLGVAWTPFWLGSNRLIAWVINAAYFGVLLVALELALFIARRPHPVSVARIAYPALLYALVCLWVALQTATFLPPGLDHPIYQYLRTTYHLDVAGSISVFRPLTYLALLRLLTAGAVFWLFLQLCRAPARAYWTVQAVAIIAIAYAIYGIVAFFIFPNTILWLPKQAYLDSVTSTFINRNSYATYAGIGLICALTCTVSYYARSAARVGRSAVRKAAAFVASTAGAAGWYLVGAFVLGAALVQTGSRGGILASAAGVIILLLLISLRGRGTITAIASFLGVLVTGLAIFTFGDFFAGRLLNLGFASADRLAVYRLTLLSILDAPWKGWGYGTFYYVFPMYRDNSLSPYLIWDKAHNTYLEIIQGLGIPMAVLFFAMLLLLAARCAYAALIRRSSASASLAATSATVIVGLHSFVDFSMQIQAVALTWTALLAAGVAQSWSRRIDTRQKAANPWSLRLEP